MKNIILILFIGFTGIASCQTANIITETVFNNIEINNIPLLTIKNTYGSQSSIENLFGSSITNNIDPDGDFYSYVFNGFRIGFSSMISNGTHDNPIISRFEITSNSSSITINGVTITIGSSINLLGNVIFNTMNDGYKSIVYMYCNGCNNFISIRFNQLTNIITKIIYIEQT